MIPELPDHLKKLKAEGLTAANLRFIEALADDKYRQGQMSDLWYARWMELRLALDACALLMQAGLDAEEIHDLRISAGAIGVKLPCPHCSEDEPCGAYDCGPTGGY